VTESQPSEIRGSARVLLVDAQDRLLLFQTKPGPDSTGSDSLWITVGGGVEPGEPLPHAAARELHEETGLTIAPEHLGNVIATTGGKANIAWLSGEFRDDFFFLRIDAHEVDTSGFEALEASTYLSHRWWTIDELADTDQRIVPYGLAALMRDLIGGRIPAEPVRLPWHH
jgi:8-oxo-dGTP pyrophosphatase MutT (NUDIX family)